MITIPRVFIITGTPGTGKTTVSQSLSTILPAHHIELSKYSKENGYILEEDFERNTSIVDMDALRMALLEEIRDKEVVTIDGHYGQDLMDTTLVERVIILRKQPWDLKPVLEKRGYSNKKIWENLEAEIMGIITHQTIELFPLRKIIEVNTSEKTPDQSTEEILALIDGENRDLNPIDWVTYPETMRVLLSRPCTL